MNLFDANKQEKDPSFATESKQAKDPRTFERNCQKMGSTTIKVSNVCAAPRGIGHRMNEGG